MAMKCPECNGEKFVPCTSDHRCPNECDDGIVRDRETEETYECQKCDGPTSLPCDEPGCESDPWGNYTKDCPECQGSGEVEVDE